MENFTRYNFEIFNAFLNHQKQRDIIDRKAYIVEAVEEFYNRRCETYLFVGFNPAILKLHQGRKIYITEVNSQICDWLKENNILFTHVDKIVDNYDCIIATDEYLTFADSEESQIEKIKFLCDHSNDLFITTVKDYKNQEFKEREYSQPAVIRNNKLLSYLEMHDWSQQHRACWTSYLYRLEALNAECIGEWNRRTMFFKQFAKFAYDSGASDFLVHKNLMYKGILKKNYEHVISVRFEN